MIPAWKGKSTKYVRVYRKNSTVYVPSSESGLPQPLSRQRVCPSPQNRGRGGTFACGRGVGGVPIPTTGEKAVCKSNCLYETYTIVIGNPKLFWFVKEQNCKSIKISEKSMHSRKIHQSAFCHHKRDRVMRFSRTLF
jgi:hypothetical protein